MNSLDWLFAVAAVATIIGLPYAYFSARDRRQAVREAAKAEAERARKAEAEKRAAPYEKLRFDLLEFNAEYEALLSARFDDFVAFLRSVERGKEFAQPDRQSKIEGLQERRIRLKARVDALDFGLGVDLKLGWYLQEVGSSLDTLAGRFDAVHELRSVHTTRYKTRSWLDDAEKGLKQEATS